MDDYVTGTMIYYYFVCKRKLWYFCNEINMETENENVMLGKLLDENSYKREDKHISINNLINIDFIRECGVIHEVKKSRAIENAAIWQVKYYLYYLKQKGVSELTAKIDYPLLKKSIDVELLSDDEIYIGKVIEEIMNMKNKKLPPYLKEKSICRKCAYFDLCFI